MAHGKKSKKVTTEVKECNASSEGIKCLGFRMRGFEVVSIEDIGNGRIRITAQK